MRDTKASRFDPSRYGLDGEDLNAMLQAAETIGFNEPILKRKEAVDRQTMAAMVART
jgi:hypothetical protein